MHNCDFPTATKTATSALTTNATGEINETATSHSYSSSTTAHSSPKNSPPVVTQRLTRRRSTETGEQAAADNTSGQSLFPFLSRTGLPPKRRLSAFSSPTPNNGGGPRESLLRRGTSALKRVVSTATASLTRSKSSSTYTDGLSDMPAPTSDASSSSQFHSDAPDASRRQRRIPSDDPVPSSAPPLPNDSDVAAPPPHPVRRPLHLPRTRAPSSAVPPSRRNIKAALHRRHTSVSKLPTTNVPTCTVREAAPSLSQPLPVTLPQSSSQELLNVPPSATSSKLFSHSRTSNGGKFLLSSKSKSKQTSQSIHHLDSSSSVITPPPNDPPSDDGSKHCPSDDLSPHNALNGTDNSKGAPLKTETHSTIIADKPVLPPSKSTDELVGGFAGQFPGRTGSSSKLPSTTGNAFSSLSTLDPDQNRDDPNKVPGALPDVKPDVQDESMRNQLRRFSAIETLPSRFKSLKEGGLKSGEIACNKNDCIDANDVFVDANGEDDSIDNTSTEKDSKQSIVQPPQANTLGRRHTAISHSDGERLTKQMPPIQTFLPTRRISAPVRPLSQTMPEAPQNTVHEPPSNIDDVQPSVENGLTAPRVSRTGFMERTVAAAVISAARHRTQAKKNRATGLAKPAHHRLHGGFENPWPSALKEGGLRSRGGSGSRTFFHKVAKDRRPPDEQLASMILLAVRPDFSAASDSVRRDKCALASIWIGHSTFFLQARGLTVLTDPVWSPRLGPLGPKRLVPPPCAIDELPEHIDVVVLSSACYDHYDKNAVVALASRVGRWLVPLGLKALLVSNGLDEGAVTELDWWNEHNEMGTRFICTPSQHYSIREGTLWCSWAVVTPYHRFLYCGATGYRSVDREGDDGERYESRVRIGGPVCPAFADIGRRFGPFDTAFLPIGGYKPRVLMSGVQGDAVDMLFVHQDLGTRRSIAHRWGTFASSDEGFLDPIRTLEYALQSGPVGEQEFCYLKHGRLHVT